jgi:uncharacterized protein YkwD
MGTKRLLAGLAAVVAVLVAPSTSTAEVHGTMAPSSRLQVALLDQLNALRAAHGLSRLRLSPSLSAAANQHSSEMARRGYFSHDSANGSSFSARVQRFYSPSGFHSWSIGENLLWASPNVGALRALKLWLASPPHRENLLSPSWREVGLSAVHAASAPGVYAGRPTTVLTADFGARSR